jgi:hypothetical protein
VLSTSFLVAGLEIGLGEAYSKTFVLGKTAKPQARRKASGAVICWGSASKQRWLVLPIPEDSAVRVEKSRLYGTEKACPFVAYTTITQKL